MFAYCPALNGIQLPNEFKVRIYHATTAILSPASFQVSTPSGASVGDITKKWRGLLRELVTNADTFSVSFPMDLDVRAKALLLGATFMIDFTEFEHTKNV
ncbi:Phospholipid scramblase [Trichostrongylus colubriformis]|uniref:Phospholipid scramblase n=1 Tax=Trichostrongylus colubriformis TaxID=6319 RepID=A0AAN8FUH2_TRICO